MIYPITQITWQKTDFYGPDIDLHPSGYTVQDAPEPEKASEDDPLADPQRVLELVKQIVDAPWDTEGWSITATKQQLVVKAPRAVQRQVARALAVIASMK